MKDRWPPEALQCVPLANAPEVPSFVGVNVPEQFPPWGEIPPTSHGPFVVEGPETCAGTPAGCATTDGGKPWQHRLPGASDCTGYCVPSGTAETTVLESGCEEKVRGDYKCEVFDDVSGKCDTFLDDLLRELLTSTVLSCVGAFVCGLVGILAWASCCSNRCCMRPVILDRDVRFGCGCNAAEILCLNCTTYRRI